MHLTQPRLLGANIAQQRDRHSRGAENAENDVIRAVGRKSEELFSKKRENYALGMEGAFSILYSNILKYF